jgi:uncharacterized membrane protein (DUF4010 family)
MNKHVLANLKAYASLVGAILTAVSTQLDSPVVTVAVAVCSAIVVWAAPNTPAE